MHCFILAGGFATRLWPLTEKRAKPLLPLAGKPLLTHLVTRIPAHLPVTVSTNAVFAEDMRRWAAALSGRNVTIYVEDTDHDDAKLGALGATRLWIREKSIDEDIMLLAGDNYVGFDLADFLGRFSGNPLLAAYDIRDPAEARRFGTVLLEESGADPARVRAFEEKPEHPSSTLVSTGCYVLPRSALPMLDAYAAEHPDNIGGIFEELLRRNIPVECVTYNDMWRDIGSFRTYLDTHRDVLTGKHLTEPSARIDDESILEGSVYVGDGCRIEKSTIRNSMIFGNVRITDAIVEDCVIDEHSVIDGVDLRGMMIREGTRLRRKK